MSSVTLEQAWDRVCRLVEEAAQFGRVSRGEGGEVVGWWPAKPRHDALDSDFRIAWLRHEVFTPLDDAEVEELEREIGQALPPLLRRFYTKCSNGLEFASGDLSIYGLRRGTAHDPCELSLETVECRADVEPEHFFFGSWGDDKHLIYLDTRDGSVHVAALRTATPLRTWPSFEEFLRASC